MNTQTFFHENNFELESGKNLSELRLTYHTLGTLNTNKNNTIWITHALTANSNPEEWWEGLVGKGKLFNPEKYFIICVNVIGSCYGSTSPISINPASKKPYYHNFPEITIRDIVKGLNLLRIHLGIKKIHTLVGGSLGGQQAVEWAISEPQLIENLFLIATNAQHSPWGIAFNESQRLAIKSDITWLNNSENAGLKGLKAARSIALLSYRNYNTYTNTQKDNSDKTTDFKAASYQNYQGEKLIKRFNAFSYWHLSKAMDSHNVARGRRGIKEALAKIKSRTLVIAINSDLLFPISEAELLSDGIKDSQLVIINSNYGHDGFLIETKKLNEVFEKFYLNKRNHQHKRIVKTNFKKNNQTTLKQ